VLRTVYAKHLNMTAVVVRKSGCSGFLYFESHFSDLEC
jgi:hypothetical protein